MRVKYRIKVTEYRDITKRKGVVLTDIFWVADIDDGHSNTSMRCNNKQDLLDFLERNLVM